MRDLFAHARGELWLGIRSMADIHFAAIDAQRGTDDLWRSRARHPRRVQALESFTAERGESFDFPPCGLGTSSARSCARVSNCAAMMLVTRKATRTSQSNGLATVSVP